MTDLTIPMLLLAVIFALVAFYYASVGLPGAGHPNLWCRWTLNVLLSTVGCIVHADGYIILQQEEVLYLRA